MGVARKTLWNWRPEQCMHSHCKHGSHFRACIHCQLPHFSDWNVRIVLQTWKWPRYSVSCMQSLPALPSPSLPFPSHFISFLHVSYPLLLSCLSSYFSLPSPTPPHPPTIPCLYQPPKDWMLLLVIAAMVMVDLAFLLIVTAVDSSRFYATEQRTTVGIAKVTEAQ